MNKYSIVLFSFLALALTILSNCTMPLGLTEGQKLTHEIKAERDAPKTGTLILSPSQDGRVFSLYPNDPAPAAPYFGAMAWTWGGQFGKVRSMMQFDLSAIPPNADIIYAAIELSDYYYEKHSSLSNSNASWIERITQPWSASTACWNNQPSTTFLNRAYLPESSSPDQHYTQEITFMIEDMIRYGNYGMMIKLYNEAKYAKLLFGSSENPIVSHRPKLKIIYLYY